MLANTDSGFKFLPCYLPDGFASRSKKLGALEDKYGPATAAFIVDLERRPEFD